MTMSSGLAAVSSVSSVSTPNTVNTSATRKCNDNDILYLKLNGHKANDNSEQCSEREESKTSKAKQSSGDNDVMCLSNSNERSKDNSEYMPVFDEALFEEKFAKLGFDTLMRCDSPSIQINGNSSLDDDEDGIRCRAPLIRSTSLKTGKTPPGTPQRKKSVRFADALGLDLESCRHIISDDLPNVPQSAFGALKLNTESNNCAQTWVAQQMKAQKPNLSLEFIQPSSLLNFLDRVRTNRVCLENCIVSNGAGNLSVTCIIRVLNISFEKSVTLRYTTNEWLSWNEALASYIPNSCDGWSDKFTVTFSISAGGYYLSPGQRLLFALRYVANNEEYWDSNFGLNYSLIYRV